LPTGCNSRRARRTNALGRESACKHVTVDVGL
jgi:hypothetical protein